MATTTITKISIDLDAEDMKVLERIGAALAKSQGSASRATTIRYALRLAAKRLPK